MNAGKLGVTLNLSRPGARSVSLDLCARADVVCSAYLPKAMRAWGLDYRHIRARNQCIVMLSSGLFGQTGLSAQLRRLLRLHVAVSQPDCEHQCSCLRVRPAP